MGKLFESSPDNVSYFTKHPNSRSTIHKPKNQRKCTECGKEFLQEYSRQAQCSDTCKNIRYSRRVAHPSKYTGSFLNESEFNKAWEDAKKLDIWHNENILANQPPK